MLKKQIVDQFQNRMNAFVNTKIGVPDCLKPISGFMKIKTVIPRGLRQFRL